MILLPIWNSPSGSRLAASAQPAQSLRRMLVYLLRLSISRSKKEDNKSFIYDKSVYVVEVTLTQNGDRWTGAVTRVWEDSDGDGPLAYILVDGNGEADGIPAPESLDFENYRYTSVSVQKFVSGVVTNDSFTFEATVYADFIGGEDGYTEGNHLPFDLSLIPQNTADGSGLTINEEHSNIAEFSITHGNTQIIHVPYGASITVKEIGGTDYITTYRVGSGGLTQGDGTDEFTADGVIQVVFNNEKTTSVTIEKKFDGDSNKEFNFTATITSPAGTERTEDFTLEKDGKYVIDGIQFGSTIKVEETNGSGYLTTYHTETKIEAESGSSTGSVAYQREAPASGGIQLGNINGDTSTVTLSPEFYTAGAYDLMLHYHQNDTRYFRVSVNGGEPIDRQGEDTTIDEVKGGDADNWQVNSAGDFKDMSIENLPFVNGKNSIKIGGTVIETKAPDGYNKLTTPVTVQPIVVGAEVTSVSGRVYYNAEGVMVDSEAASSYSKIETATHATVLANADRYKIVNQKGAELPETGGMGTTLIYVLGSVMVLGAAVLLITKKRMA